jgi:hypothetical protein
LPSALAGGTRQSWEIWFCKWSLCRVSSPRHPTKWPEPTYFFIFYHDKYNPKKIILCRVLESGALSKDKHYNFYFFKKTILFIFSFLYKKYIFFVKSHQSRHSAKVFLYFFVECLSKVLGKKIFCL